MGAQPNAVPRAAAGAIQEKALPRGGSRRRGVRRRKVPELSERDQKARDWRERVRTEKWFDERLESPPLGTYKVEPSSFTRDDLEEVYAALSRAELKKGKEIPRSRVLNDPAIRELFAKARQKLYADA